MTDQQVLTKCIEIAIENDWKPAATNSSWEWCDGKGCLYSSDAGCIVDYGGAGAYHMSTSDYIERLNAIIFDHSFAKALWGEEEKHYLTHKEVKEEFSSGGYEAYRIDNRGWQYHLQQLATSEDRIDYLRKWLEENTVYSDGVKSLDVKPPVVEGQS